MHTTRGNHYSDVFTQHDRLFVEPPPPTPSATIKNEFTLFAPPPLLLDVTTSRRDVLQRLLEVVHEYLMLFPSGAADTSEQLNYIPDLEEIRTALKTLEVAKTHASDGVDVDTTKRPTTTFKFAGGVVGPLLAGDAPSIRDGVVEDIRASTIVMTLVDNLTDLVDGYKERISRGEGLILKGMACGVEDRRKRLMMEAERTFELFGSAIVEAVDKLKDDRA